MYIQCGIRSLCGVLDGHSGPAVAEYAAKRLPEIFQSQSWFFFWASTDNPFFFLCECGHLQISEILQFFWGFVMSMENCFVLDLCGVERFRLWGLECDVYALETHLPDRASQHTATHCNTLQHTATHYNILQHTAPQHCNTLQHTATYCPVRLAALILQVYTLQHTVTHCNTLQHTATHCNFLQHNAKHHCNTL